MFFWKFSEATTVYSHAQVEGTSEFARHLRNDLYNLAFGGGPLVWLTPGLHAVELDPNSDELLSLWLLQEAKLFGLRLIETDFAGIGDATLQPGGKHRNLPQPIDR